MCEPDDVEDETEVLDPEKVAAARAEEVSSMNARGLWDVVPFPPGVHSVSVLWVDVSKSDGSTRSRLVARDTVRADMPDQPESQSHEDRHDSCESLWVPTSLKT